MFDSEKKSLDLPCWSCKALGSRLFVHVAFLLGEKQPIAAQCQKQIISVRASEQAFSEPTEKSFRMTMKDQCRGEHLDAASVQRLISKNLLKWRFKMV
jgi:hypothetical protein